MNNNWMQKFIPTWGKIFLRGARWLLSLSLILGVWATPMYAQDVMQADGLLIRPDLGNDIDYAIENRLPPPPRLRPQIGPGAFLLNSETTALASNALLSNEFDFPKVTKDEHWIRVDLSEQILIAYEGTQPIRSFVISSGKASTPTVIGEFRINRKVSKQPMRGGIRGHSSYYYHPDVQWVMYFHGAYALHGSYWHNDFGTPVSHGCVNMTEMDAKWIFDWTGPAWDGKTVQSYSTQNNPGTRIVIHQ